jgi:hypothetical protein
MAGKRPKKLPDSMWTYLNSAAVLDKVGLKTIAHYIGVRRQHIASYIVNKPIFQVYVCVDLVSGQRGPFPRLKLTKACWTCPPPLDA